MNIATNPWSFASADVPAAIPLVASPNGMVQQAPNYGAVIMTSTGAHGLSAGQFLSYIGDTNGRFLGWYKVIAVIDATHALLANLSSPTSGSPFSGIVAASGGGSMLINQVQQNVRMEDISWQNVAPSSSLVLRDRNGLVIWSASTAATAINEDSQNRGKLMWVDGLTLDTITTPSNVFITIN